jgi:hypothetical protein
MTEAILHLLRGVNVVPIVAALQRHPELWNQHPHRTEQTGSPHHGVDDIWLRYNDYANWTGDLAAASDAHTSVWYPSADRIPVKDLCYRMMADLRGDQLGGVLITRVPPGGAVLPHVDGGWHAGHYRKFGVQLQGDLRQAFQFEGEAFSAVAGDVYEFDNSRLHWVTNNSEQDRMTLIVCIKTETRSTLCPSQ